MNVNAIFLFGVFLPSIAGAATILGDTVQIRREIPSQSSLIGPFSTTVVAGTSDSVSLSSGNNLFVNPESNSIVFNFGPSGGAGGGFSDHRIVVAGIDWTGEPTRFIQSISATSDVSGFTQSSVSFDAHSVSLSIGNYDWSGGQSVLVQLTPSAIPEPVGFCAIGLMSVFLLRRSRRA